MYAWSDNYNLANMMMQYGYKKIVDQFITIDGMVQRAPKFIATATLFKFMTLENMLLCHKDKVRR